MTEQVISNSIDLMRLVADAEAAGFNPLTVLRNGGAAGYAVQRQPAAFGGGSFTSTPEPMNDAAETAAPFLQQAMPAPINGQYYTSNDAHLFGRNDNPFNDGSASILDSGGGEWEAESEYNIAIAQARKRVPDVITDAGRVIPTRSAMFRPPTYTAPTKVMSNGRGVAAAASPVMPSNTAKDIGEGKQAKQAYETDKLPNVVTRSTFHPLLPGIDWEETGGVTRGETFETGYSDFGGTILAIPKLLNDIGWNTRRAWDHNMPTLQEVNSWLATTNPPRRSVPAYNVSNPSFQRPTR